MCVDTDAKTVYDILARNEYARLQERIGLKKADKETEIIRDLQDALLTTWDEASKEALNDAIRELVNGVGTLTDTEINKVLSDLRDRLGPGILEAMKSPLYEAHLAAYDLGQSRILGTDFSFNLIDEKAIDVLHEHNLYWVRNYYDNNLSEKVQQLGEQVMREGLSRHEAGQLFEKELAETYQQYGTRYWEGYANHAVTRSREISSVSAYEKAGTLKIVINAIIDRRTSEICRGMNGKVFTIKRFVDQRDKLLNATDPEDVKHIAPWYRAREAADGETIEINIDGAWKNLSTMDGVDVPSDIALPPYHFDCRTTTDQYTE